MWVLLQLLAFIQIAASRTATPYLNAASGGRRTSPEPERPALNADVRVKVENLLLFNFSGHPFSLDAYAKEGMEDTFLPRSNAKQAWDLIRTHSSDGAIRTVQWEVNVPFRQSPRFNRMLQTETQVSVPVLYLLLHLFTVHQFPELRNMLIHLIQNLGQLPDHRTADTQEVLPMIFQLAETFPMDLQLFAAVATAGSSLSAVMVPSRRGVPATPDLGVSILHLIVQDQSNMLSKHLLQVQDHMLLEPDATLRIAYEALSHGTAPDNQTYLYDVAEYETLQTASPEHFGQLQMRLDSAADISSANSMREIKAETVNLIDEDIAIAKFNSLLENRSTSEIIELYSQLILRVPDRHWNPLHIAALNGWVCQVLDIVTRSHCWYVIRVP